MDKNNYDAIENTSNTKYNSLFENPTYENIENAKVLKLASEKKKESHIKKKTNKGVISPAVLGILICLLTLTALILTHFIYLVS